MNWYKMAEGYEPAGKSYEKEEQELNDLETSLEAQYPGLDLIMHIGHGYVELAQIVVPKEQRSQGIGTAVIRRIQEFAKNKNMRLVIRPQPERGKKDALDRFYRNLGFVHNQGRNKDYEISSPFAKTMYWSPK
jgi:GNAT superfamily N-acetyltransferase